MKTKKINKKVGGKWSFLRKKNKVIPSSNNKPLTNLQKKTTKKKGVLDFLFGNLCEKKATLINNNLLADIPLEEKKIKNKTLRKGILYKGCSLIFKEKFPKLDENLQPIPEKKVVPKGSSPSRELVQPVTPPRSLSLTESLVFSPKNYGNFVQEDDGCYIFAMLQLLYTIPELRKLLKTINLDQIVRSEFKSVKIFPNDFDKAKKLLSVLKNIFEGLEKGECVQLTRKNINNNTYLRFLAVDIIDERYGNQGDTDQVIMRFFTFLKVLLNNEIISFFIKKISYSEIKTKTCKQRTQIINKTGTMPDNYISERNIIAENIAIEKEIYNLDQMNISIKVAIEGKNIQECINYYQSFSSDNDFETINGTRLLRNRIAGCEDDDKNPHGEVIREDTKIILNDDFKYIFIQLNRFDSRLNKIDTIVTANKIITINDIEFIIQAVIYHSGSTMRGGHYTCINFNEDGSPLSHIDSIGCRTIQYHSNKTNIDNMINSGYIYLYRRLYKEPTPELKKTTPFNNESIPEWMKTTEFK